MTGEHDVPSPLGLPGPNARTVEELQRSESVALFVERARSVAPEFELTERTAPAIGEICLRLDGLPLAIELAAARAKLLDPHQLLTRLERRLPLLTGGPRDAPERQRTLRAAIEWSYDSATDGEAPVTRPRRIRRYVLPGRGGGGRTRLGRWPR